MPGFLDRFFGGEKREPSKLVLPLEELGDWLRDKIREEEDGAKKLLLKKAQEIFELKGEVEGVLEELEGHEFPEDVKKRVYKPVLTHRPTYVRGVREGISGITSPEESYQGLGKFHRTVVTALKAVEKVQLSQGRYLVVVFREEFLGLGGILNRIMDLNSGMKEILEEAGEKLELLSSLDSRRRELEEKLALSKGPRDEKRELKEEISRLEREEGKKEEELSELEEGREYLEYLEAEEKWREREELAEELRSRALNLLGPKRRVFRKYKKVLKDREKRDEALEGYIQDPASAFFSEGLGYPRLRGIMEELRGAMEDGSLALNEKERQRLRLEGQLDGLMGKFQEFQGMEPPDSRIVESRAELEKDLGRIRKELEHKKMEVGETEEKTRDLKAEVPRLKSGLEEELSELEGREVRVEILRIPSSPS